MNIKYILLFALLSVLLVQCSYAATSNEAKEKVKETVQKAADKAQDLKDKATASVKAAASASQDKASSASASAQETAANIKEAAAEAANNAAEKIQDAAGKAADKAKEFAKDAGKKVNEFSKEAGKQAEKVTKQAGETAKKAKKEGEKAAKQAKAQAADSFEEAKKVAADYGSQAKEIIEEYSEIALEATKEYREELAKVSSEYATHLADTYLDEDHAKVVKAKYFNWNGVAIAAGIFAAVFFLVNRLKWLLALYTLRAFVVTLMLGVYGTLLVISYLSVDPSTAIAVSSRSALRLWNNAAVAAAALVVAVNFLSVFKGSTFRNIFLFFISLGLFFEQLGLRPAVEQAVGPVPKYTAHVLVYLLLTVFSFGLLVPSSFKSRVRVENTTVHQPSTATGSSSTITNTKKKEKETKKTA